MENITKAKSRLDIYKDCDGCPLYQYCGTVVQSLKCCSLWNCVILVGNGGHWHFQMFSEDEKYALADAIIQTVEQFNKLIDALNADYTPLKW